MPPKASHRRNARLSSREPEQAPLESPGQLARTHLPALHGTPSSRRQYSYGSALEPPPRPGAGLQKVDISNAVSEALTRRPEDLDDGAFVRPPRPQARTAAIEDEDEEDELARDSRAAKKTGAPARDESRRETTRSTANTSSASLNPARHNVAGSDVDSLRSFGMESDYYGDATIETTPRPTPAPEPRRPTQQPPILRPNPFLSDRLPDAPDVTSQNRPTDATKTRAGRVGAGRKVARTQPQQPPLQNPQDADEEEDDEEEEIIPRTRQLGHERSADTPIPRRVRLTSARELRTRKTGLRDDLEVDDPSQGQRDQPRVGNAHIARLQTLSTLETAPPQPSTRMIGTRTERPNPRAVAKAFEKAQDSLKTLRTNQPSRSLFAQGSNTGRRLGARDELPIDREDPDAVMQREIQEAEEQAAREQRAHELRRGMWRRRWAWLWSWFSLEPLRILLREQQRAPHEDEDLGEDGQELTTNWWQLLNPLTYLRELVWLADKIMDHVINFIDSPNQALRHLPGPGSTFRWILLGILASTLSALLVALLSGSHVPSVSLPEIDYSPTLPSISWPSLGGFTSKIGGVIPSFSWLSSKDDSEFWKPSDDRNAEAEPYLKRYGQELDMLKKAGKLHQDALTKLESIVPKIVHMDLKGGKPVISQDFWHALRDLIHKDGGFLILDKKGNSYDLTSEQQWQAIAARLAGDPKFTSKLNMTAADIERRLDSKMTGFWDSWIKKNDDKIAEILGPALDKIQTAGSGREFDQRFSRLVKQLLQGNELKEVIVTRDEFLHHVRNEFAAHRTEIRAELDELKPHLETLIRDSVKLATQNAPQGMSKDDITTLVHGLVRKAIADMNLEAMAKGKIHLHWDVELRNQVNFFAIGAGATIDAKRTSPTYDPHQKGTVPDEDFKKGIRGVLPYPALAALTPWQDEGDCWCAARDLNKRRNPHGATLSILLGHSIVPQHIVIEHILPGATIDPDSRPRDIEIWASFPDDEVRERALDFSATHFPDDQADYNFTPPEYGDDFVKIGQFVYEGAELHDGVHVHRLSTELSNLRAETDQIVVRAVSNYGAEKHTCFYRVRVFGELSS